MTEYKQKDIEMYAPIRPLEGKGFVKKKFGTAIRMFGHKYYQTFKTQTWDFGKNCACYFAKKKIAHIRHWFAKPSTLYKPDNVFS